MVAIATSPSQKPIPAKHEYALKPMAYVTDITDQLFSEKTLGLTSIQQRIWIDRST
jgi:hypothetical protein